MQTKSEMINRIAELAKENARLKNERTADLVRQIDELKAEIETLKCWLDFEVQKKEVLKAENERLKKENEILLGQLVINDDEDVTVQISQSQFDEYNKYRQTLQEIKKIAERQLLVTNVRTYQMVYYSDFSEYRNEILQKITKAEEE